MKKKTSKGGGLSQPQVGGKTPGRRKTAPTPPRNPHKAQNLRGPQGNPRDCQTRGQVGARVSLQAPPGRPTPLLTAPCWKQLPLLFNSLNSLPGIRQGVENLRDGKCTLSEEVGLPTLHPACQKGLKVVRKTATFSAPLACPHPPPS